MSDSKPTQKSPAKTTLIAKHEEAVSKTEALKLEIVDLEQRVAAAREAFVKSEQEAQTAHEAAYAEEIAAAQKTAQDNELRHKAHHDGHCKSIESRRKSREARGEKCCAHDQVKVFTVDGFTHEVIAAHGLTVNSHGFASHQGRRESSRYKAGCGLSVDTPHDELDHERFDQGKPVNCPTCIDVRKKIDAGEIAGGNDYLTAKEHLAMVREMNKRRNKELTERRGRS